MVQGMAFLSKKGFNPTNQVNRKQVWEAQQSSKLEQQRFDKRQKQLQREREDQELWAARNNGDGSQAQLRFMYDLPPGMNETGQSEQDEIDTATKKSEKLSAAKPDVTQVQPGDDAAAAAFRRMLAASSAGETMASTQQQQQQGGDDDNNGEPKLGFAPVLQGSMMEKPEFEKDNDTRSALEKAVGRKDRGGALSLEEQVARFPQLKHAPMARGMSNTDVNVNFKPLGAMLRNVKCLACGIWGHSRGDRECSQTGWDPFASSTSAPSARQRQPQATATVLPAATNTSQPMKTINSSIRPTERDRAKHKRHEKKYDDGDDRSVSSHTSTSSSSGSSSSSSKSRRRRRKRKHRSKHKRSSRDYKRYRHKDSKKKRKRHSRSKEEDDHDHDHDHGRSTRKSSRKSHHKERRTEESSSPL